MSSSTNACSTRYSSLLAIGYRTVSVAGLIVFLACCGGGSSSSVSSTSPENSGTASTIASIAGTQTTLLGAVPTLLQFVRYDISPGMSYSYGFSISDYDSDGRPDISYFDSYTSGRARLRTSVGAIGHVMWNNGQNDVIVSNETFDFTTSTNPAEFLFERQVPMDVNGDGLMDIVGVSNSHSSVVAYINPGAHNLPWVRRVLSSQTPGPVNLTVTDVNGDGKPDVIVAMRYQPSTNAAGASVGIAWLENTGSPTGEWIYHTIDTTARNFADPRTVQAGDVNKDGKVDVVVSDAVTGVLAWYSQSSPDSWQRHVIPDVSTVNAHFGRLVDMDGDGQLDILLPISQGVAWMRNIDKGASWEFHSIVQFTDQDWSNVVTEVAVGDIDHDGSPEVVFSVGSLSGGATSRHSGGLYIAHMAQVSWQVDQVYTTQNSVVGVQLADFDGSGYLDIVSNTEYQQNSITLWKNALGN